MPKVYIANDSGHDFRDAQRYGEVVVLTKGGVNIWSTDRLIAELKEKLADSQENDFLVLSGNAFVGLLAYSILMAKHMVTTILIFSFTKRKYEARTMHRSQYQTEITKEEV